METVCTEFEKTFPMFFKNSDKFKNSGRFCIFKTGLGILCRKTEHKTQRVLCILRTFPTM